jgi:alpha-glucosidase
MTLEQMPAWLNAVHHDGSPHYVTLQNDQTATLRLRTSHDAPIARVFVRTAPDGEQHFAEMHPSSADAVCRWWTIELPLSMPRTAYRFRLLANDGAWWFSAAGPARHIPTDAGDFVLLRRFNGPSWLHDTVFYQIFPDRFADGDPVNNVRTGEYTSYGRSVQARTWGEPPARGHDFFGGDLLGIEQRLDYLTDLGVSALYLNPIFTAPSNHKYDVADYDNVDPHFGGNAALASLRQALESRGMRLMLDIVPNHCGSTHSWFTAAQMDANAPTAEFFTFHDHPEKYESWFGVPSLPKLNYRSEQLRAIMYAGPNAIMRRWLRAPYRIDGWRVDVANMLARQGDSQLGHKIGRGIRRAVKAENPDTYLLGEHFFDGTPQLQGDELDATMNYQGFQIPLLHWLVSEYPLERDAPPWADRTLLSTEALAAQWRTFLAAIPWQVAVQQFNLLGSHDTPRVTSMLGADLAKLQLAVTLLCTFPGVPSVYYGDEVGLEGVDSLDCRRCMPWDAATWRHDLRAHYQALIRLRRTAPALIHGGFQVLYAAGETIAFIREAPEQRLLVLAQRAASYQTALPVRHGGIADGTRCREVLSGSVAQVAGGRLPLAGLASPGAQIWEVEQ